MLSKNEITLFKKLFNLYYPRLTRYAIHFLKDQEEVEDLVQETFLQLWKSKEALDDNKDAGALLFKILKNRCLNHIKHRIVEDKYRLQATRFEAEELYHISLSPSEEFIPLNDSLIIQLKEVISGMPEKCQTAFRLKWFEGKKIREIAEMMEISSTMVEKHLSRGLKIARRKIIAGS